jgi:hypothetical protein
VGSRKRQFERLEAEMQRGRVGFYRRLAVEAKPSATRLSQAYANSVANLDAKALAQMVMGDTGTFATSGLRYAIQDELKNLNNQIFSEAALLQRTGAQVGYESGIMALNKGGIGVLFNAPTLESIQSTIGYVESIAFRNAVEGYAPYHAEKIADAVLSAVATGRNPNETAAIIKHYLTVSKRPLVDAVRLTRTTQLYAARTGNNAIYQRTGVSFWIWSAAIGDDRTCLACIVMHGTEHPVTEILNDHHQGRCAPIPKTPKWEELGFTGGEIQIQTGADWFKNQPDDVQQRIMGNAMFEAWRDGKFRLGQVVGTYHNDIFGEMRRKRSLKEILGDSQMTLPGMEYFR